MYRNCTTEETASRQRQLESCLLEQMLHTPYPQISVSDLCAGAGISRKSFYRYFGNKDGCLNALMDHTIIDFTHYVAPAAPAGEYTQELVSFLLYWKEHHLLLSVLLNNDLSSRLVSRYIAHLLSEENRSFRFLGYSARVYTDEELTFVVTGLLSLVLRWHRGGYQPGVEQLALRIHRLLTQPMAQL